MDGGDTTDVAEGIVSTMNMVFDAASNLLGIPSVAKIKDMTIRVFHPTQTGGRMSPINHAEDICESSMLYTYLNMEIDGKTVGTHANVYVDENLVLILDIATVEIDYMEIDPEDTEDGTVKEKYVQALEVTAKMLTAAAIGILQVTVEKEKQKNKEEG